MHDTSRRGFLVGLAAATCAAKRVSAMMAPTMDGETTVFLSDLHVRNEQCFQYQYFTGIVDEILAMRPLPKRVVVFGDIAYTCGLEPEYRTSRKVFQRLIDAGIELTFGMGNHDRRSNFLKVWPEYRGRSLVPGKIVSKVDLGPVDLIMLDGLQGTDDRAETDMGPVPGKLDGEQEKWLYGYLKTLKKPTLLASHFPLHEMCGTGKVKLAQRFREFPLIAGYIFGHEHRWEQHWQMHGWGMNEIRRTLCLPSTGHWGDIGYVIFRVEEHQAVAEFVQKDFFFGSPVKPGEKRPQEWDDLKAERGASTLCTFRY